MPARHLLPAFTSSLLLLLTSCADRAHRIVVSVADQRMAVFHKDQLLATFPISTSRFTLSDTPGSNGTPLGKLEIAEKIGSGQPVGMKFKSRVPTGEIIPINAPGRDPIVTRILWLRGLESWNRNAHSRYIYIHGTPEEAKLGTPASYGCVRMASRDIIWLFDTIGKDCRVNIIRQPLANAPS
jgi:lipoprotein-anchoring transpeptidase ErfK/SrfK